MFALDRGPHFQGVTMKIHQLFPYLCVKDAARAIDFYVRAFGATEKFRLAEPSGRIGHAELMFGSMTLMLSDEFPEYGIFGRGRRDPGTAGAGRVLRRARRSRALPVQPSLDDRPPHRARGAGRDAAPIHKAISRRLTETYQEKLR